MSKESSHSIVFQIQQLIPFHFGKKEDMSWVLWLDLMLLLSLKSDSLSESKAR